MSVGFSRGGHVARLVGAALVAAIGLLSIGATQASAAVELVTQYQSGNTNGSCGYNDIVESQTVTFPGAGSYVLSVTLAYWESDPSSSFGLKLNGQQVMQVWDEASDTGTYHSVSGTVTGAGQQSLVLSVCNNRASQLEWRNLSLLFTPDTSTGAAQDQAIDFVGQRQNVLLQTIDLPTILDAGSNGVRVETGSDGTINAMAFAAQSDSPLTPAEDTLMGIAGNRPATDGSDTRFWIAGRAGLQSQGADTGKFAITMLGADKRIGDSVLLGVTLEGDWMTLPEGASGISGLGLLAGPYVSVALGENLAFNAHVLAGRSWNDQTSVQNGVAFDGSFITNRLMAGASLSGAFGDDGLTVRPDVSVSLINEATGDYTLSGAGGTLDIAGFSVATLEASAGSGIEYRLDQGNGIVLVPSASLRFGLDALSVSSYFIQGGLGLAIETDGGVDLDLGLQSRASTTGTNTVAATGSLAAKL